jgi:hypothetical protein
MAIYSLLSIQFILFFVLFLGAVLVTFYLPGSLFFSGKRFTPGQHIFLSCITGMVLWGMQAYVFGYLQLRGLSYLYLLLVVFLAYRKRVVAVSLLSELRHEVVKHRYIVLLLSLGVLVQMIPVFGSGVRFPEGVRFFGVNGYDGIMHLAFINSIVQSFPPMEPGAVGNHITNYHYWSDLIIAELVRVWRLPISHTFFQYMPLYLSVLTGLGVYQVMRVMGFSKAAGVWGIFFFFFAGDAAYVMMLLLHRTLSFASPAIDNGVTQFLNMPNAMARPVFLAGIMLLMSWLRERRMTDGILMIIVTAGLVGIKVYYGLFTVLGISLIFVAECVMHLINGVRCKSPVTVLHHAVRKERVFLILLVLLAIISAGIYLPPNKNAGGLGWYPLEWPKQFLGTGALDWREWWLRRQVYEAAGNTRNLFILDIAAIIVALVAVHGTRLIGLLPNRSVYKTLGWRMLVFFLPGLLLFHILGLFTLQKSGGFNVFNFFIVSTTVLSLFSAMIMADWSRKSSIVKKTVIIMIVLLTIPRALHEVSHTVTEYTQAEFNSVLVSNGELAGLTYIARAADDQDVVQSHPANVQDQTTPYVSFFTGQLTYLTGTGLQETHNQPIGERKKRLQHLFSPETSTELYENSKALGIDYFYFRKKKEEKLPFTPEVYQFTTVFENNEVIVYRVIE